MATFCQEPFFQSFPFGLARYELIVDADNNPLNYRILCCNSAFCELFGFSMAEMEGKTILEIMPQPNPAIKAGMECFGRVALQGENESFEYYSERRKQLFQVQVYAEGKGVITSVFFDITYRREQDEIIRLNEEKYHTLFESMTKGVFYQAAINPIRFLPI
jgi:PAS domain S-box-containing protein